MRLYKLDDFAIFLGDQGRDAIIMKRIVTFEHLPAVGPSSSVELKGGAMNYGYRILRCKEQKEGQGTCK